MQRNIAFFLLTIFFFINIADGKELTILYTAETHGMIDHCDCPNKPDGGIYLRSTLIKDISTEMEGNLLILDGGGAFAGGIDDQYTMGDDLDMERSKININAMAKMGYDAVCIGEDEFRYGLNFLNTVRADARIPFLSCNIFYKDSGKLFAEPYILRKINNIDVAIIGVTTKDLLSGEYSKQVESLTIEDPVVQVKKYVREIRNKVDVIVLLSHLGDDVTEMLVKQVDGLDVVLNSHRWKKSSFKDRINKALVVQFNYQAKKIARIDLKFNKKNKIISSDAFEVEVSSELDSDQELLRIVTDFRENVELAQKRKVKLDLYVMSYCPYGLRAEEIVFPIVEKHPDLIDFNLYYIVSKKDDEFTSLHGVEEVNENLRQICVKLLKPEVLFDYVRCVNKSKDQDNWKRCAEESGIDIDELKKCISSKDAENELNLHYTRKSRLYIDSSPTAFINNRRFSGGFSNSMFIMKEICNQISNSEQLADCQNLPECFSDKDCFKDSFIGKCKDAGTREGKCVYEKDVEFTFTVLITNNALMTNEIDIIKSTKSIFPGMKLKILELESEEGKNFRDKYKITMLPAYHFEDKAKDAQNFNNVKNSFKKIDDGYLITPEAVGASLDITRERKYGNFQIFVSSLSEQANDVLGEVIKNVREKPDKFDFEIHYLAFRDEEGKLVSRRGLSEIEENIRQLVVQNYFPEKYYDYISERAKKLGSSYWEDAALSVGLDPKKIKEIATSSEGEKLLNDDMKLADDLQLGGDIVFFLNNQETIYLRDPEDLKKLLEKIENLVN